MPFVNSKGKKLNQDEVKLIISLMQKSYAEHIKFLEESDEESKLKDLFLDAYKKRQAAIEKDYTDLANSEKNIDVDNLLMNEFANTNAHVLKNKNILNKKNEFIESADEDFTDSILKYFGDKKALDTLKYENELNSIKGFDLTTGLFAFSSSSKKAVKAFDEFNPNVIAELKNDGYGENDEITFYDIDQHIASAESAVRLKEKDNVNFFDLYNELVSLNKANNNSEDISLRVEKYDDELTDSSIVGSNNIPGFLYKTLDNIADNFNKVKKTENEALRKTRAIELATYTVNMLSTLRVFKDTPENNISYQMFANSMLMSVGLPPMELMERNVKASLGAQLRFNSDFEETCGYMHQVSDVVKEALLDKKQKEELSKPVDTKVDTMTIEEARETVEGLKSLGNHHYTSDTFKQVDPVSQLKAISLISQKFPNDIELLVACKDAVNAIIPNAQEYAQRENIEDFLSYSSSDEGRRLVQDVIDRGEAVASVNTANERIKAINEEIIAENKDLKDFEKELISARHNDSEEYLNIISMLQSAEEGFGTFDVNKAKQAEAFGKMSDEQLKTAKLFMVKDSIDKYLDHKAKDGIKRNSYDKLAAVEKLNQYVSNKIAGLKADDFTFKVDVDGKPKKFSFKQSEFYPTYQDELSAKADAEHEIVDTSISSDLMDNVADSFKSTQTEKYIDKEKYKNAANCIDRIMLRVQENNPDKMKAIFSNGSIADKYTAVKDTVLKDFTKVRNSFIDDPVLSDIKIKASELNAFNERIGADRTKFGSFANDLERASRSTSRDSAEYKDIVKTVKLLQNGIDFSKIDLPKGYRKDWNSLNDKQKEALPLYLVHEKLEKYLDHKAKDGVKPNTYEKLAVIEDMYKYVGERINQINPGDYQFGGKNHVYKQSQVHATAQQEFDAIEDKTENMAKAFVTEATLAEVMGEKIEPKIQNVTNCINRIILKAGMDNNIKMADQLCDVGKNFVINAMQNQNAQVENQEMQR